MATAERETTRQSRSKEGVLDDVLAATVQSSSADLMQMKMDNESIMAECRIRPRDYEAIKADLEDQLDAFPDLADNAIYCKPVGKEKVVINGADVWREKYAEGLSIRAAELLAEAYGFNRISTSVTPLDEFTCKVSATFTDFQKGRIWTDQGVATRKYKARGGKIEVTPEDRFYSVTLKAEVSRRAREAILRCVNAGLKAWFEDLCNKKLDDRLDDKAIEKLAKSFEAIGVTQVQLEEFIGRPFSLGVVQADRRKLLGVWNAIKDRETTVADAFGGPGVEPPEPPKNVGRSKLNDEPAKPADPAPELAPGETVDAKGEITDWRDQPLSDHAEAFGPSIMDKLKATRIKTVGQLQKSVAGGKVAFPVDEMTTIGNVINDIQQAAEAP